MLNLFKMDAYRMRKARTFQVCLILAFLFALASTPLQKLLTTFAGMISEAAAVLFPEEANLSALLASPYSTFGSLLALISVSSFFFADLEHGYIKNIAGQMPKRGYTVLSKFLAAALHNLIFLVVCALGRVLGTLPFQRIVVDAELMKALAAVGVKFLLMQSISAVLLFFSTGLRAKSLSAVFAVLMGSGLMSLVYSAIDLGLHQISLLKNISISDYMPDQLMGMEYPPVVRGLIVACVVIAVFLPLAIKTFDRRDVQ